MQHQDSILDSLTDADGQDIKLEKWQEKENKKYLWMIQLLGKHKKH